MQSRILIVLIAVFSACCFAGVRGGVTQDRQDRLDKKIVELKSKRRDTLKQRLDVIQTKVNAGEVEIMKVISARDDLFQAELELATDKAVRVKLSEQRFKNMIDLEKITAERYANGIGPLEDKLVATAARLQAEIEFLSEQARGR